MPLDREDNEPPMNPVADTLRGFNPRITILEAPPPPPPELDWEDDEAITRKCTPFFDDADDDEPTLPDIFTPDR